MATIRGVRLSTDSTRWCTYMSPAQRPQTGCHRPQRFLPTTPDVAGLYFIPHFLVEDQQWSSHSLSFHSLYTTYFQIQHVLNTHNMSLNVFHVSLFDCPWCVWYHVFDCRTGIPGLESSQTNSDP